MVRGLAGLALVFGACAPGATSTPVATGCDVVPIGAVAPAPAPGWCLTLPEGLSTATVALDTWLDDFAAATHSTLGPDYIVFESIRASRSTYGPSVVTRTKHFAHNGHWMVDVESAGSPGAAYEGDARDVEVGTNFGGAAMRPRLPFRARDGELAIEVDVSAAMDAYKQDLWAEIVVTTAPAPTGIESDPLHAGGVFGGAWSLSCRLHPSRQATCDLHEPKGAVAAVARSSAGNEAWRRCGALDRDGSCRDRFRLELSGGGLRLAVNGRALAFDRALPPLPDALLQAPIYVYFASWGYIPEPSIARFHWGRVAINR